MICVALGGSLWGSYWLGEVDCDGSGGSFGGDELGVDCVGAGSLNAQTRTWQAELGSFG
jgi:hypothetical protein